MLPPLLSILAVLAATCVQDVVFDARADTLRPFVGEVVAIEVELEAATRFLDESIVPRTLRRLDRAVAFESGAPATGLELWRAPDDPAGATCVVDGAVARAARTVLADGRERLRVVVHARVHAAAPFVLAPAVEYAVALDRSGDLFGGSVATDLEVVRLAGPVLAFEPRALPSDGAGLPVGVFELVADAARPAQVAVDARFEVVARVRGAENLAEVVAPELSGGEAFHVLGVLASRSADVLELRYDVLAVAAPSEPLELRLATFDPTGDGRRVDHVWPVDVTVTGAPAAESETTAGAAPAGPGAELPRGALLAGALAAAGGLAAFVAVRVARGRKSAEARREVSERRARARAELERGEPSTAFERFLASFFDLAPGSLSGATLAASLEQRGVAAGLAARAADHVARSHAARYGGADGAVRAALSDEARRLAAELEGTRG